MIKKLQLACAFLFLTSLGAFAQSGGIKGKILDKATKEPLPFASVTVELGGAQKGGAQSDFDGEYNIKPLAAGEYTVRLSYVGYNDLVITGVVVSNDKITFQNLEVGKKVVEKAEVEIIAYKVPLIDPGNVTSQTTVTREDIAAAPSRDVRSVAATAAGVFQRDDGDDLNVRGSRTDGTDYYIDGVKVRGSKNLPKAGVEQISLIQGGIPAQYGDATGGIVNVTTRGPEEKFSVGLNLETSELFDDYGHNLVSVSVSGPMYSKKMADGSKKSVLGFFFAGDVGFDDDPDPSGIGMYELNSDVLADITAHPNNIIPPSGAPNSVYTSKLRSEYLHADSFGKTKVKFNNESAQYSATGKIDYQPSNNNTFSVGGSFNYWDRNTFNIDRALYNYAENPQRIDLDWRVFGRFTKKIGGTFKEEEKSASLLRNTYFSIQASYGVNKITIQDEEHKDKFWNYGYRGSTSKSVTRTPGIPGLANPDSSASPFGDTSYHYTQTYTDLNHYYYTPSGMNSASEAYTIAALQGSVGFDDFHFLSDITNAGGLLNGSNPAPVYAEWQSIGTQFNRYTINDNQSYRFTFSGNTDIKNHAISLGFEFEQRIDRTYDIFPDGLWTSGRQYANDTRKLDYVSALNGDTLVTNHHLGYQPSETDGFYERIRQKLGVGLNERLDFDALTPDQLNSLSLDAFTADELVLESQLVNTYAGYDYTGKRTTSKATFYDFFNKKENGSFTREVDAFRPVYMAGYIQDNFSIDNLVFNVGVRVDRFDANQKMMKDKYSLYDIKTAGDVTNLGRHPDNIGSDYVVYVDNATNPTKILGYRDGNVWYDVNGRFVSDPDFLARENSGTLVPILVHPEEADANGGINSKEGWNPDNSFVDYEPQYSVMPRVAFSFPISDEALFFAHYDVLTSRPAERLRLDPVSYIQDFNTSSFINNPNLKPEKSTHYELGFKQRLSKSSAISISAFYEEKKNLIQVTKIKKAYPNEYTTYDNIDFANIKGLTLGFDLRRTGNIRVTTNYTLQFADGTGSGVNSNLELTETDQPNIRIIMPLDFDQRHLLTLNFDYRYSKGSDYNGPILGGKQIFSNAGFNTQFRAGSGTPYTRQSRPTREGNAIGWQDNGERAVEGTINAARMPWTFSIDFKIDKDFEVKVGDNKMLSFNVYFQMQNALDFRNVTQVYRATGNADDDGYINSQDGILAASTATDTQGFKDQYYMKLQNPNYYTMPRRSRIGVSVNF